jgi:hypothetical protein
MVKQLLERVRKLREARGLTQEAFSKQVSNTSTFSPSKRAATKFLDHDIR